MAVNRGVEMRTCLRSRDVGDSRRGGMTAVERERLRPANRREEVIPRVWATRIGRGVGVDIVVEYVLRL